MRLFLYRLSVQMGRFVHEIVRELDGSQIAEYMAFDQLEPFGELRADVRAAMLGTTMANKWRTKGERKYSLKDFMLFEKKSARRTPDELLIMCRVVHETVKAETEVRKRNAGGH